MAPKDVHLLILKNPQICYLMWQKGLCRFKVRILRQGYYPGYFGWVHVIIRVLKRERKEVGVKEGNVTMEIEVGVMQPRAKE